ncbi:glycine betaine ABC transporter substrate-binding protein [Dongia soli]|uniref:Glycine betaine ABC transporter substrate-binding protein n=1 Tax=Dongia soli TaxID=600628 RepID=A0ABU5EEJ0_9PROT|nr:glycine betaine ABC transporter substrate-binding protein [Dongia soli]MDY0884761.1 glycine betaine ABC transporter substrate-binding protein [Dongia soli]
MRYLKRIGAIALSALLCFGPALFGSSVAVQAASLTVGGKDFTEQFLMAEMTKQLLESKGYEVDKKDGMGSNIVRAALESGEVDLYWEYTGTSLITFNKVTDKLSPEATYEKVRELDGKKGLVWLKPSKANDTYALAIRKGNPKTDGMVTISDLAAAYNAGKKPLMATTAEFTKREDGLLGLQKTYGFKAGRANIRPIEIGLVYPALGNGDVDIAVVGATDGRVAAMKLILLKDDKNFFPNYAMVPVVRKETLDAHPDLQGILEALADKLDDATMQKLNGEVDVERKSIHDVATEFLKAQGLI